MEEASGRKGKLKRTEEIKHEEVSWRSKAGRRREQVCVCSRSKLTAGELLNNDYSKYAIRNTQQFPGA